jgi:uncharacterized membrane protein
MINSRIAVRVRAVLLSLLVLCLGAVPAFAQTTTTGFDPGASVSTAMTGLGTSLGTIGAAIVAFVVIGIGIRFGVKWLREGGRSA